MQRDDDAETFKVVGHNEQMQFLSRVETDTTTVYGQRLEKGTVFFLRQDFDTVENPCGFSADAPVSAEPAAGAHFIGLSPSAQHFEKMRREMDSQDLKVQHDLAEENLGFTKMLVTTHRQTICCPRERTGHSRSPNCYERPPTLETGAGMIEIIATGHRDPRISCAVPRTENDRGWPRR